MAGLAFAALLLAAPQADAAGTHMCSTGNVPLADVVNGIGFQQLRESSAASMLAFSPSSNWLVMAGVSLVGNHDAVAALAPWLVASTTTESLSITSKCVVRDLTRDGVAVHYGGWVVTDVDGFAPPVAVLRQAFRGIDIASTERPFPDRDADLAKQLRLWSGSRIDGATPWALRWEIGYPVIRLATTVRTGPLGNRVSLKAGTLHGGVSLTVATYATGMRIVSFFGPRASIATLASRIDGLGLKALVQSAKALVQDSTMVSELRGTAQYDPLPRLEGSPIIGSASSNGGVASTAEFDSSGRSAVESASALSAYYPSCCRDPLPAATASPQEKPTSGSRAVMILAFTRSGYLVFVGLE